MTGKTPSSDRHNGPPALAAPLTVLEGMPGAGKTTTGHRIAATGVQFVGEYTTGSGTTIPIADHPAPGDDDAHQANWLRKAAQARAALADGRPVVCDRDWLSSLAYAYSIADSDGGRLLHARTAWAAACLDDGTLLLPGSYLIFDIDVAASLHRRAGRLKDGHPWSLPGPLRRLQDFYADPVAAVTDAHPALGAALRRTRWRHVCGHDDPQHQFQIARDLAGHQ
jgi:hypothetical protein